MRIALTSDWHIHNYPQFASPWREGLNTRARDIFEVVGALLPDILRQNNVDFLIHGGDWNWNASNDYRLVNLTRDAINNCRRVLPDRNNVLGVEGNHDSVVSRPGIHNARPYLEEDRWHPRIVDRVLLYPIGYNDTSLAIKSNGRYDRVLIFMHKDIQGGHAANGFIYKTENEITLKNLLRLKRHHDARIFAGHYHDYQLISNVVRVVGAPVQHNRGDADLDRGFCIYDTVDDSYRFIGLEGPKFLKLTVQEAKARKFEAMTYVTLIADTEQDSREGQALISDLGLMGVVVGNDQDRELVLEFDTDYRNMSDEELLKRWLERNYSDLSSKEVDQLLKLSRSFDDGLREEVAGGL